MVAGYYKPNVSVAQSIQWQYFPFPLQTSSSVTKRVFCLRQVSIAPAWQGTLVPAAAIALSPTWSAMARGTAPACLTSLTVVSCESSRGWMCLFFSNQVISFMHSESVSFNISREEGICPTISYVV